MPKDKINAEEEGENISIPKSEWEKVMARLEAVESKGEVEDEILGADTDDVKPYYCHIAEYKDRPITRVYGMYQAGIDEVTKVGIMKCNVATIQADGSEKEYKAVDFSEIKGQPEKTCEIIKVIKNKMTKKGDLVDERFYDEKTNNMVSTGRKVRLAVNYTVNKTVVKWNDEVVELDEVNIR